MQISARFVNNWHYSVKQWHTLNEIKNDPNESYSSNLLFLKENQFQED